MNVDDGFSSFEQPAVDPGLWPLDPQVVFLNHGSFGSCPRAILAQRNAWQERVEREPVQFLVRELEPLLDAARQCLADFVGAPAENLVLVTNATSGVNTVLRSLEFSPGDELLVTDQEYNACRNTLDYVARRHGARVVVAPVPFPLADAGQVTEAILARTSPRTRLALVDHVTSQTGLVFPIAEVVRELSARGIDTLVDGAHAPGLVPLDLRRLGAAYYTGNCHKWLCAPKTAAFLYVRPDLQEPIHPLAVSHGLNTRRQDRSRFQVEFGWQGTADVSAFLTLPETLRYLAGLLPGGWPAIMARNRRLALAARTVLCEALQIPAPAPESCIGSMAAVPLPDARTVEIPTSPLYVDALQDWLWEQHRIEVPIAPWPGPPRRVLRVSAQLYNCLPHYRRLAEVLPAGLRIGD